MLSMMSRIVTFLTVRMWIYVHHSCTNCILLSSDALGKNCMCEDGLCRAAVILLKGAQKWCAEHSSKLPQNAKEKAAFKQMLKSWQRSAEGVPADVSMWSPEQLRDGENALFAHVHMSLRYGAMGLVSMGA